MDEYTEESSAVRADTSLWYRGPFLALSALIFLLPLIFFPSSVAPFQFTKTFLAIVGTALAFILFIAASLKGGGVRFAWSPLLLALYLLLVGYGVGTLFSSDSALSFAGYQFDVDTFFFMVLAVVMTHLVASVMREKSRLFLALATLAVSTWAVLLFQVVQVLFGSSLPGLEYGITLLGRWHDLAMFAGLLGGLSLLTLEFLPLPRLHYFLFMATYVVSFFIMAVANVREVWILFGLSALAVLLFSLARRYFMRSESGPEGGVTSMVIAAAGFVLALFFLFWGEGVATSLQQVFTLNLLDVRPAFSSTLDILRSVFANNILTGSGPNTFSAQWLLYRNADVVQTPFWNIAFNVGSGTIISSIAVGGLIMLFVWAFFLLTFAYTTVRALFEVNFAERRESILTVLTAFGATYLVLLHLLAAPSSVLTILMFIFIGLFIASLHETRLTSGVHIIFRESPRFGFVFVLLSMVAIVVALGSMYNVGVTYAAALEHNRAVVAANSGAIPEALGHIDRAIALDTEDRYFRTGTLIRIAEVNQLVASGKSDTETQTAFQNALARAVEYSAGALAERSSYENLLTRALVYATVVPLNIEGAFENATTVFEEAKKRNPNDPEPDFNLARLHAVRGDMDAARDSIAAVLAKKADYTDAILLRAEIELNEGNLDEAITAVKNAIYFEPNNSVLLYQLGILLLQDQSFEEAAAAFELALERQTDFANAKFFLSQAYASLDRLDEAEALMAELLQANPDNDVVRDYRAALARGENPFVAVPVAPEEEDETVIE